MANRYLDGFYVGFVYLSTYGAVEEIYRDD